MDKLAIFKPKEIKRFKDLYEKHYGIRLNTQTAIVKLCLLVRMVEITSRPLINEYENGNENVESRNWHSK